MEFLQLQLLPAGELDELRRALEGEHMPAADLACARAEFLRLHDQGRTVGYAGLEGEGADLLLRSFWIAPAQRNRGFGSRALEHIEARARQRDCSTLHLLTTTAEHFFLRHRYLRKMRSLAPPCIADSQEFQTLCPAEAIYMAKTLKNTP